MNKDPKHRTRLASLGFNELWRRHWKRDEGAHLRCNELGRVVVPARCSWRDDGRIGCFGCALHWFSVVLYTQQPLDPTDLSRLSSEMWRLLPFEMTDPESEHEVDERYPGVSTNDHNWAIQLAASAEAEQLFHDLVRSKESTMKPFLRLYKEGDTFGIQTNIVDEQGFWIHLAKGLSELESQYLGDWEFQYQGWLPLAFEIVAKMRGYRANVSEYRVISAGAPEWNKEGAIHDTSIPPPRPLAVVEGSK